MTTVLTTHKTTTQTNSYKVVMTTAAKIKAAVITVIMETTATIRAAAITVIMETMVITVITATTMIKAKAKATMMIVVAVKAIGLVGKIATKITESPDSRQLDCIP